VQGIAIASARPERRSSADSAASWVKSSRRAAGDSRTTRVPGERVHFVAMLAAVLLVAMAILGAAGSLGYDIVRPLDIALGRAAVLRADPVGAPPIDHELEVRFVPELGPAQARAEQDAPEPLRRAALTTYHGQAPSTFLPPEALSDLPAAPPSDTSAIPAEP
jgi:hypothetical protein